MKNFVSQHKASNAASDLVPLPYESIISSIWRYAWRNGLSGNTIKQACSANPSYSAAKANDGYSWFKNEIFFAATGWDVGSLEVKALSDVKNPFRTLWWHSFFRYCPICVEHGYHSFWHQSKFLSHCPLDGALLAMRCNVCDSKLPEMTFSKELTHALFSCSNCRHPIGGVAVTIASRIHYQERRSEIEAGFSRVQQFWKSTEQFRNEICSLVPNPQLQFYSAEPRLRLEKIVQQWILDKVDLRSLGNLPWNRNQIPALELLEWRVKEVLSISGRSERLSRARRVSRGTVVYRTTLRRLEWLVDSLAGFSPADYRQLLHASREQKENLYKVFPAELVALCVFRSYFETIASVRIKASSEAQLEPDICFLIGEHLAHKIRLCWRAEFIVSFAWIYWIVKIVPAKKVMSALESLPIVALSKINTEYDPIMGDLHTGKIAFPKPDTFTLSLFPLMRGLGRTGCHKKNA